MEQIKTEKKPIFNWATGLETGALEQAKNLANLPFVHNHVALMADSHQGFGMPIGGVLATNGAIICNAVGVDIGCFTGDTRVALLSGINKSLKELYKEKKEIWVYSLDKNMNIVPGKAVVLKTRKNSKLLQVVISGGISIKCTPDHKFMLVDGSYKEAKYLKPRDSLMPLYRSYQTTDGYEYCSAYPKKKGNLTHKMVANHIYGKHNNLPIHHKDFNWYNNIPENLQFLSSSEHSAIHAKKNSYFNSNEFKKNRSLLYKDRGYAFAPHYLEKKQIIAKENLEKYMESAKFKSDSKLNGARGKKYLIAYNKSEKGRKTSSKNGKLYGFGKNHKVLFTKELNYKEDVYCLNVIKYHNFALEAGIFVHNCGMHAVQTNITRDELTKERLVQIMKHIRDNIPVGFNHRKEEVDVSKMPNGKRLYAQDASNLDTPICAQQFNSALKQMGTLGGGNHFIEIQYDPEGIIWFMIHSGSRNLGLKVAKYYNELAIKLNKKYYSVVPKEHELAFLPSDSEEAEQYINEMNYCLEFARLNRQYMADIIKEGFEKITGALSCQEYDVHHNYVAKEKHFGKEVWVHRKGATSAKEGEIGIIPGSQGTSSYIVKGLGNRLSFNSCSHGAGRKMGRRVAQRTLNLEDEKKKLDDQGIMHSIRNQDDLDEAPGSYKDIKTVMENQKDLVEILVELKPIAVVKA